MNHSTLNFCTVGLILLFVFTYYTTVYQFNDGMREFNLVKTLLKLGYKFVLPKEYFSGISHNKTAMLIHDVDFSWRGMNTFIQIENKLGIKSAFYPRYDMARDKEGNYNCLRLVNEGFEIGFQYECLSLTDGNFTAANKLFLDQISFFKPFSIHTTTYHGDKEHSTINNLDLYNKTLWESLDLAEIYKIQNCSYYTDTDNKLLTPKFPLEDLVIIQLHTDWTR